MLAGLSRSVNDGERLPLVRYCARSFEQERSSREHGGAKRGANSDRHRAIAGHAQPLSVQLDSTSGPAQQRLPTCRKCLLSSRPQVRILLGAQLVQVVPCIRNYHRYGDVLLVDNHSF
jgi:hypothetical protein